MCVCALLVWQVVSGESIYLVTSICSSSFFSKPLFFARMTSVAHEEVDSVSVPQAETTRRNRREEGRLTAFEDVRVRDVLFGRHLGALRVPEPDRGRVGLEPRDCPRLASLADDVDGLTDPNGGRQELVRLVRKSDEEPLQDMAPPWSGTWIPAGARGRDLTGYMAIVRK